MPSLRPLAAALIVMLGAVLPARADVPAPPLDPAIVTALGQVSPQQLRATDERLVGFGTRSTFSEKTDSPRRGVFAARAHLVERFREIARRSGGRMTVALDTYTQTADPQRRIPRDVVISSVIATLKGDEPGSRTYVMSSHYDSRNTDNNDGVHDAPGADDNGSATAAVVESSARAGRRSAARDGGVRVL